MSEKPYYSAAFGETKFPRELLAQQKGRVLAGPLSFNELSEEVKKIVLDRNYYQYFLIRTPGAPNSDLWNLKHWGLIDLNGYKQHGHFDRPVRFPNVKEKGHINVIFLIKIKYWPKQHLNKKPPRHKASTRYIKTEAFDKALAFEKVFDWLALGRKMSSIKIKESSHCSKWRTVTHL